MKSSALKLSTVSKNVTNVLTSSTGIKPLTKNINRAVMLYANQFCDSQSRRVQYEELHGSLKGFWPECLRESWKMVKRMVNNGKLSFISAVNAKSNYMVYTGTGERKDFIFAYSELNKEAIDRLYKLPQTGFNMAYVVAHEDSSIIFAKDLLNRIKNASKKTLSLVTQKPTKEKPEQKNVITFKTSKLDSGNLQGFNDSELFVINCLSRVIWSIDSVVQVTSVNKDHIMSMCTAITSEYKNKPYFKSIEIKFNALINALKTTRYNLMTSKLSDLKTFTKQYISVTVKSCMNNNSNKAKELITAINNTKNDKFDI